MYNPEIHHRQSIRLRDFDYSANGAYFVTMCTQARECLFGNICDGETALNEAGRMVESVWQALAEKFPEIVLDEYVIMPNHFHGIVCIVGAPLAAPGSDVCGCAKGDTIAENQGAASSAPTLGKIMRVFKSISAIEINRVLDRQGQPLWQRNYYERIIRDENELAAIREYIVSNPMRWDMDKENPDSPECEP